MTRPSLTIRGGAAAPPSGTPLSNGEAGRAVCALWEIYILLLLPRPGRAIITEFPQQARTLINEPHMRDKVHPLAPLCHA